jgi:peptide/nickel transport system substrate-binding protein
MNQIKQILVFGMAVGLLLTTTGLGFAKNPPKERLVPPIGLTGATADYSPTRYNMQRMIVESWKKLGVDAYNDPTKYEIMIGRTFRSKQFDVYIIDWSPMLIRLEPNLFLNKLLHSQNAGWDGLNICGYQNPEYDKLADAQMKTIDVKKRKELVDACQAFIYERQPKHPLMHQKMHRAYNSKNFSNVELAPGSGPWSFWTSESAVPTGKQRIFRSGGVADFKTINPVMASEITDQYLLEHLYDFLMRVGTDGNPKPWAATGYKWIDDTTIEVSVREGMKFHDGTPVTMEDITFSFEYCRKSAYLRTFLGNLASVTAVGKNGLRFKLKEADAGFPLTVLCQVYILPKHIWSAIENPATFANALPIGSGPFRFDHWRRDEELFLKTNKEHFFSPKNDGFLWVVYGNQEAIVGAMEQGTLDSCGSALLDPILADKLRKNPDMTVVAPVSFGVLTLEYNTRWEPFNDVYFRRAMSYSVPIQPMINQVLNGNAVPAGAMISPENKFWHNNKLPAWPFDMEKAKQELIKAGYEWDDQGNLYYPAPEKDKRLIDTTDKYPKQPKTWGKK